MASVLSGVVTVGPPAASRSPAFTIERTRARVARGPHSALTPLYWIATMVTTLALASTALATAYVMVCALIAHRFTTARRKPPTAPTAAARPVRFEARDRRAWIDAWYVEPASCRAAVVFVHGKDACRGDELKTDSAALAAALCAAGIAVLMIDLRGHGTSSAARLTYGDQERHDVLGAVDWLAAQGHGRIGVLGASMGAASALLAAAEERKVLALVADSPFADFGGMIERQYRRLCRLPRFFLPGSLLLARLLTGVDLRRVRPLRGAAALRGRPVLVIHSEGDRFVPVADGRDIAAACGARLWTTDTPGHVGSYRGCPTQYTALVLAFFQRHLCVEAVHY
jgi:dipeptidyl aminopeptidase/acylaminoacyl peptidase